jgi:hypothetical protein
MAEDDGESLVLSFEADLDTWGELLDRKKADVQRIITLEVYREITLRNPVDTGYSRSNWNMAVATPDTHVSGQKPEKGAKMPPKPVDNAVLAAIDGKQKSFVTNSLDYIRFLEEGSSQQAPSGFIAIALAKVEAKVETDIEQARSEGFEG